jgi:hypothetical protein
MPNKQRSTRVKITERALFQRINRKLKRDGQKLCTARNETIKGQLGRFYIVETGQQARGKSGVAQTDVDLEKLAQKLEVIQSWEELAS